ncbi:lipopolysaccharide biosynthesis protein [Pseudoalteromonas prydzensis]|uniref:lipopolysaccharide biosynthesis protein n=1 Tax=Pseudoalteromonas prydzensis TaxID=182141 RepID=UPI0007E4F8E6|nr:oligosaccharide flippase family protein [Pseudoalteromonas prydzensis]MBE0376695.1 hypothetical protein [Pseudoalteromonas prydzensis ACAM 620]
MILPKSNYVKNIVTLLSGSMVAQIVTILATPLLTRLYSPEQFGVLAIFLAVVLIIGSIINARYELAIMLPESESEARHVVFLCLLIACIISVLIFILIIVIPRNWYEATPLIQLGNYLYFIPLVTMSIGFFNAFNYYSSRKENYALISYANISKSLSTISSQGAFSTVSFSNSGLIFGYCVGAIFSCFFFFKAGIKFELTSIDKLKSVAYKYRKFPQYSMWAILANSLSVNLLNLVIGSIYSLSTLGFYSLLQRVLGMPIAILGTSIGQVFYKEIVKEKKLTGKGDVIFVKTAINLVIISVLAFIPVYFFLPKLFGIVFGENWIIAGEYAQILVPLFALRFVTSALTLTNSAFEKQNISFYWQIILLLLSMTLVFFSYTFNVEFINFLKVYNAVISFHYIVLLLILFLVSKGKL